MEGEGIGHLGGGLLIKDAHKLNGDLKYGLVIQNEQADGPGSSRSEIALWSDND